MNKEQFKKLITKVENGTATNEELISFNAYMNRLAPGHSSFNKELKDEDAIREEMWANLQSAIHSTAVTSRRINWYLPMGIAALLLIGISIGLYYITSGNGAGNELHAQVDQDIRPAGNAATLTLAGGKKIVLTNNPNGVLLAGKQAVITQTASGQLSYVNASKNAGVIAYDTLTTPAGGVYNLKLSDGTMIWLNAASSLRFPEQFANGKREVQLLYGEAYLEVDHQANAPFSVRTPKGTIEDIGTHFNICAYADDQAEKTTLLEGSIRVTANRDLPVQLIPGQQAQLNYSAIKTLQVVNVDIEQTVAWKNGSFSFDNEKLGSIMQKIARWYGVKIAYQNERAKNEIFYGNISRFKNASEVMEMLERTGNNHFELKDHVIYIKPKQ